MPVCVCVVHTFSFQQKKIMQKYAKCTAVNVQNSKIMLLKSIRQFIIFFKNILVLFGSLDPRFVFVLTKL